MNKYTAQVTDLRNRKLRTCTILWSYNVFSDEITISGVILRGEDIKGFISRDDRRGLFAECRRQVKSFTHEDRVQSLIEVMK